MPVRTLAPRDHAPENPAAPSEPGVTRRRPTRRAALLGGGAAVGLAAIALGAGPASAITGATSARRQLINATISMADEKKRTNQFLGASELNPTGFYLPPDTELTIQVEANSAASSALVVGAPDAEVDTAKRKPRDYALKVGPNTVKDPYGGPLYWRVTGAKGYLRATIGLQAQAMPFFIHGTTTEGEFQEQLDRRNTPYAEFVSGHAIITTQIESARRFRGEDHNKLLSTYEEILNIEDRVSGYDESSPLNARLSHRYHLVTRGASVSGIAAYATNGFTLYPSPILDRVLTVDGLRLRGWGIYHELGHQHQEIAYKPPAWTEVTVNWYSLAVNLEFSKRFGQFPRLHSAETATGESAWTSAPPKLGSPGVDITTTFTLIEQLVLFEQLRIGLPEGAKLLPTIHKLVREEKPDNRTNDDVEYRFSLFVYYASKASGYDLRDFTQAWGIHHSGEIDARITALNLPKPSIDLTQVRDEEGQATAAPILRSLGGRAPDLGL